MIFKAIGGIVAALASIVTIVAFLTGAGNSTPAIPGTGATSSSSQPSNSSAANSSAANSSAALIPQAISFSSLPPSQGAVEGTYVVMASGGGSGNPVIFSIDSGSPVCSISGSTVTFHSPGSCVIDANQAGNTQYQAAPQVQQTVKVNAALIPQAISFSSLPPSEEMAGGTYVLTASGGGSGNPVIFSIDSASSPVCSISGSTVVFNSPGSCVIDANQAGNTKYQAAPQVQQTVTVVTPIS
jgi:hypothetical protein